MKRMLDSAIWSSVKLSHVEPAKFRPEYAWLIPLAHDNGTFEFNVRDIYARAYFPNRPDVTLEDCERIFAEFERVGLLFKFTADGFGQWAYWTGSAEKEGRLPSPYQRYAVARNHAPAVPLNELSKYLEKCGYQLVQGKKEYKSPKRKPANGHANGSYDPVAQVAQDEREQMAVGRMK